MNRIGPCGGTAFFPETEESYHRLAVTIKLSEEILEGNQSVRLRYFPHHAISACFWPTWTPPLPTCFTLTTSLNAVSLPLSRCFTKQNCRALLKPGSHDQSKPKHKDETKDKTKEVFPRGNARISTNTQNKCKHKRKHEELDERENKGSFISCLRLCLIWPPVHTPILLVLALALACDFMNTMNLTNMVTIAHNRQSALRIRLFS